MRKGMSEHWSGKIAKGGVAALPSPSYSVPRLLSKDRLTTDDVWKGGTEAREDSDSRFILARNVNQFVLGSKFCKVMICFFEQ